MTPPELRQLPAADAATLPPLVRALWHEAHGDWAAAHALAQDIESPEAARVHAYLHRKEGDESNAGYWYRRAGEPLPSVSFEAEWSSIASALLAPRS
ncbi:MAG TPA: hypothetical protein VM865_00590 [Acidobacteriaceae bacterium]|nr:hypothetical protein [Acidobacteriaceae bacterium]